MSLGTDGVSASGNLNLMRQMYLVAGLFKDARNDPAAMVGAREQRFEWPRLTARARCCGMMRWVP